MPSYLSKAPRFFSCCAKLPTMANGEGAVRFPLSASSTLVIQKEDITMWSVDGSTDAIVGSRVKLNGEARMTPGFKLPASHVIHAVGPVYRSGRSPETFLRIPVQIDYRNSLSLAKSNNLQFVALPAISCGVCGCTLFGSRMKFTAFG